MAGETPGEARGLLFATSAYMIWGLIVPVYMKLLTGIPALETTAHRILWAIPLTAAILLWLGKLRGLGPALRSPRTLALATLTAGIIALNWGVYVYALVSGHVLDASLGYYINPVVSVFLGALVLGERPTLLQGVAIALAALAVLILTVQAGGLPWMSLVLAFSFGIYGLLRKVLPIGPTEGFFLEVLILAVPSAAVVLWTIGTGDSHFLASGRDAMLLIGTGPITAIPLILFAAGAKALDLSVMGILQYIAPTGLFLLAVFAYGEPFSGWQMVAFALIWTAVAIYIGSMLRIRRLKRRQAEPAESAIV